MPVLLSPVVRRVWDAGLRFDPALSQYVDCGDLADFDPGTGDFTVFFSFHSLAAAQGMLVTKFAAGWNGYVVYIIAAPDGRLLGLVGDGVAGSGFASVRAYNDDHWHFCSYGRSGGVIFLETELERVTAAYTAGAVASGGNSFYIGRRNTVGGNYLGGGVGTVIFYRKALSRAEFNWNIRYPRRPVLDQCFLWLPLDEAAGGIAYDQSGRGNNGALVNAPTWNEGESTRPRLITPKIT